MYRQCDSATHKAIVQLATRGCLAAFTDRDQSPVGDNDCYLSLSAALDYANESTTRVWSMCGLSQLQALAGWRPLPWDSQVLGCLSGSVGGLWGQGSYGEQCQRLEIVIEACIADAEARGVCFLSTRLPEGGLAALHAVEAAGFRIIESFLTFSRKTEGEIPFEGKSDCHVRLAHPGEMEKVALIAYRAFESFRLRVDPQIPDSRARHSRREWVRNGFKGRAEAIYVAESGNRLVGFALLRSKIGAMNKKIGEIELIAVEPKYHGRGIGKALVAAAIQYYRGEASGIQVGTQAKNLQAVGLYTRMGFSIVQSELSFHRHSDGTPMVESLSITEAKDALHLTAESDRET